MPVKLTNNISQMKILQKGMHKLHMYDCIAIDMIIKVLKIIKIVFKKKDQIIITFVLVVF